MKYSVVILLIMFSVDIFSQEKILLYPNGSTKSNFSPEKETAHGVEFITFVSEARMYAYFAPKETNNGTSVLICPGGGYGGLAAEKEGVEIARWFNNMGVTAFVLYYRMPFCHSEVPLKDAKTAMQIIHRNAKKWKLNKNRVGVIGFSAGGHLAATLGTHFDKTNKPDFMVLMYPVISLKKIYTPNGTRKNLIGENASEELENFYSNELHVSRKTPPTFIVHAEDDNVVSIENSKVFNEALKRNKVKSEFIIYKLGGHGFGMRPQGLEVDNWPDKLQKWLKTQSLI